MDDKTFEYHRDKVFSAEEKRVDAIFSSYRNILTVSAALLGLLIGLIPESFHSDFLRQTYLVGLFLLVFCILFSLIVQSYEVILLNRESKHHLQILDKAETEDNVKALTVVRVKTGVFYYIYQILTVLCFLGAIVSFLIYIINSTN